MKGLKLDKGKLRFSLLPICPILEVLEVLEFGAKKYNVDNWQQVENPESRYFDAMMRHLLANREGKTIDEESGLSHLAHAACCCLFLLWFERGEE